MKKKFTLLFSLSLLTALLCSCGSNDSGPSNDINENPLDKYELKIDRAEYLDKVYGGLMAALWGNFSGLPSEFQYTNIHNPEYVPWLCAPTYATDDDTSLEYVFTHTMETYGVNDVTYKDMVVEWKNHIRDYIWCGNANAKLLMDKGRIPPYTGQSGINPDYRAIDAQIECEIFGMLTPGMKINAKTRSDWWMRSVGDREAISCASFYSALVSELFVTSDVEQAIRNVMEYYDEDDTAYKIAETIFKIKDANPEKDWTFARRMLLNLYFKNGNTLDCEINFAMVLMSLIYGESDFEKTGQISLRAGFDNDCNAATACLMMGVVKGYSNLPEDLKEKSGEKYINTNRPGLPDDTITNWSKRIERLFIDVTKQANGYVDENKIGVNDCDFIPNDRWVDEETIQSAISTNWELDGFTRIFNPDFTEETGLASEKKGSVLKTKFSGDFVTIYGLSCLDAGSFDVYVDDEYKGEVTLNQSQTFTEGRVITNIPKVLVKRVYGLENTEHELKIVAKGDSFIEIDSIGYGTTVPADNGGY